MGGDNGGGWTTSQEIHRTYRTGSVTMPPFLAGGGWENELTQAEGAQLLMAPGRLERMSRNRDCPKR